MNQTTLMISNISARRLALSQQAGNPIPIFNMVGTNIITFEKGKTGNNSSKKISEDLGTREKVRTIIDAEVSGLVDSLMESYEPLTKKLVRRYQRETNEAEDIVSDVWVGLLEDIRQRRVKVFSKALVWKAMENRVNDHHRHQRVMNSHVDTIKECMTHENIDLEQTVMVNQLLSRLPDDERRVVEDRLAGYTEKETAERTGTTDRTVRTKWNMAVARIQE